MACKITGNDSADHSIPGNNMTDIDTYSSQGCTPNQSPVWFDLVPVLSVPAPGSSLQASQSVDVQWAFTLRCFTLCPFNSRTTLLCLRLISSSDTFSLCNYFFKLCSFNFADLSRSARFFWDFSSSSCCIFFQPLSIWRQVINHSSLLGYDCMIAFCWFKVANSCS